MVGLAAALLRVAGSHVDEQGVRHLVHHEGVVLASHAGRHVGQALFAEELFHRRLSTERRGIGVVAGHGDSVVLLHHQLAAVGVGDALHHPLHGCGNRPEDVRIVAADGALQGRLGGDDVEAGARLDFSDGDDQGLVGGELAAHHVLQVEGGGAGGQSGVNSLVRLCAVAGLADEAVLEPGGGGQSGACLHGEGSGLDGGVHVGSHGGVHAVQAAVLDHGLGAVAGLLGRLEQQAHRAVKIIPAGGEDFGSSQQGGRVGVVAAGVHHAVHGGFVGDVI